MIKREFAALIVLSLALTFSVACGGGGGDEDVTPPLGTATASGRSTAAPTPFGEIRDRDLESDSSVQALLEETNGEYVQENVIYADVNGDGIDDAVVPIGSGGTLGNVAFVVLSPTQDGTFELLREVPSQSGGGVALDVVEGKILMIEPVFGPDDPECCPSLLRMTTYAWNGAAIAIEGVETVSNPGGEIKPTASP